MYLIVGLGNPGAEYEHTRHNTGFETVACLARELNATPCKRKCKALVAEANWAGERLLLAFPQTYMNLSGESVSPLVGFYKIAPERLIVCYDDVDLPFGRIRVRKGGSAGTHNGMRNIIAQLGRDDFPRVRVGIGAPPPNWDLADYVLARYAGAERTRAEESHRQAADVLKRLIEAGVESATQLAGECWRKAAAERET